MSNEEHTYTYSATPTRRACFHPMHNPDPRIRLATGEKRLHVCPGCGAEFEVTGNWIVVYGPTGKHYQPTTIQTKDGR